MRPLFQPDTPPELASILEAGWHLEPDSRPTAAQLAEQLRDLLCNLPASFSRAYDGQNLPDSRTLEEMRQKGMPPTPESGDLQNEIKTGIQAGANKNGKLNPARKSLSQSPGWSLAEGGSLSKVGAFGKLALP